MASLALGRPPLRERAVATDSNPPLMRPPGPNRSRWRARLESQGHVADARGDFRVRNLCARTTGRPGVVGGGGVRAHGCPARAVVGFAGSTAGGRLRG